MGARSRPDSSRRAPAGPGRTRSRLLIAVALAVLAVVAYLLSQGGGRGGEAPPSEPPVPAPPEATEPEPAAANLDPQARTLPGEGPIVVELRSLGGVEEELLAPVRAGELSGRVLDARGQPIPMTLVRIAGGPQSGWRTRSDETGSYRFPEILPGTHDFTLESPGRPPVLRRQRVLSRAATRRDFQIGDDYSLGFLVRGEDGKPLADARVALDGGIHAAQSDADGIARFSGVPGGRVLVDVQSPDRIPVRQEILLVGQKPDDQPLELPQLERGGSILGQVLSWPGGPLPTVTAMPLADRPGDTVAWETWRDLPTDDSGRFELRGLPITRVVTVRVFHPAGVSEPAMRSVRPDLHSTAPLEFVITRGDARVAGRVVSADGEPVEGARVVLEALDPLAVLGELYPGLAEGPISTTLPVPAALRREWVTGRSGSFDFAVADHTPGTGSFMLTASKEGFAATRIPIRTVVGNLTVRLKPADRAGRIVLRFGGAPLPPVVYYLDGRKLEEEPALESGWYEVRVKRGEEQLAYRERLLVRGATQIPLP